MQIYKLPKRTIYGLFPDRTRENPKSNGGKPYLETFISNGDLTGFT
jgi:hypothetical protein